MGCCRGIVLFNRERHFLVVWNPLTGSSKRISHSRIESRSNVHRFSDAILYGFGYDDSQDDYIVVLIWQDRYPQSNKKHLDCFSLRTNSWINLDPALPKPLVWRDWKHCGMFLNGAIHWLSPDLHSYIDPILVFDVKERSFSKISIPNQPVRSSAKLIVLGECLAMYFHDNHKTYVWVMKEYKVQSSWTLMYEIPHGDCDPICLSNGCGSDIILLEYSERYTKIRFAKYNSSGELLQHFNHPSPHNYFKCRHLKHFCVYTESLLPFPSDLKDKDKKKKTGHRVRGECFEQLEHEEA
ncbi:hypothetical protein PIB30_000728 [Stylosanthes scabra]|uniref:F-box associated beta-propeller type 1 domain-containing protein n=1 Tax=Stylosanthes scabra TaxID=79078 RepID=A0ABU6Z1B0_9FABA|nr:hypothetical protein [Stylosanthes scabra]